VNVFVRSIPGCIVNEITWNFKPAFTGNSIRKIVKLAKRLSMQRRAAIRDFLIVSAGITVLPSCLRQDDKKITVALKNIKLNADQQALIADLSEMIIPATNTPGAKELGVPQFCLTMLDDCANKTQQENYVKGLEAFEALAKKKSGSNFMKCSAEQKTAILEEAGKSKPEDPINFFFNATKWLTVEGYRNTEFFLTKVQDFKLVPGHNYKGCVPVSKT